MDPLPPNRLVARNCLHARKLPWTRSRNVLGNRCRLRHTPFRFRPRPRVVSLNNRET